MRSCSGPARDPSSAINSSGDIGCAGERLAEFRPRRGRPSRAARSQAATGPRACAAAPARSRRAPHPGSTQPRGRSRAIARSSRQRASAANRVLRRRLQAFEALQAPPGFGGLDAVERDVGERRGFLFHPAAAAGGGQALIEQRCQRRQVAHVIGGVGELLGRQRAPGPVGARMALGEFHAQHQAHQFRIADLRRKARAMPPRAACRRQARAACRSAAAAPRYPGAPRAAASAAAGRRAPRRAHAHPRSQAGRSAPGCRPAATCTRHNLG